VNIAEPIGIVAVSPSAGQTASNPGIPPFLTVFNTTTKVRDRSETLIDNIDL
jgi:hypothetical protein